MAVNSSMVPWDRLQLLIVCALLCEQFGIIRSTYLTGNRTTIVIPTGIPSVNLSATTVSPTTRLSRVQWIPKKSPCHDFYQQTYLPGNKSQEIANYDIHKLYPLVYKYCSPNLVPLLCSVYLPKYDNVTGLAQQPCRSFCEETKRACQTFLSINRKVLWPDEMQCQRFPTGGSCFNVTKPKTLTSNQTRTKTCANLKPTKPQPFCNVQNGLFNITGLSDSTEDNAVVYMSGLLPLLHALRSIGKQYCISDVLLYFCSKHFGIWTRAHLDKCDGLFLLSPDLCYSFVNKSHVCSLDRIKADLKRSRYRVYIPHIDEKDCKSRALIPSGKYRPNLYRGNLDQSLTDVLETTRIRDIQIQGKGAHQLNVTWGNDYDARDGYGVLYRRFRLESYEHLHLNVNNVILDDLQAHTQYEILICKIGRDGMPAPFSSLFPFTGKPVGSCPAHRVGSPDASGVFNWPETSVWRVATLRCPYNDTVVVTRFCGYNNALREISWETFDAAKCSYHNERSNGIFLFSLGNVTSDNVANVTSQIESFTENGEVLSSYDIESVATILEKISNVQEKVDEVSVDFLKTIDNVLDAHLENISLSQDRSNSSTRIVQALNNLLEALNVTITRPFRVELRNLACHVSLVDFNNFSELTFSGYNSAGTTKLRTVADDQSSSPNATSITFPRTLFNASRTANSSHGKTVVVVVTLFKETKYFSHAASHYGRLSLNSYVMAGSIASLSLSNLSDPILLTYASLLPGDESSTQCSFWDFFLERWSQNGCSFLGALSDGTVRCGCNHLTNFAILMDINPTVETAHVKVLSIVSYVGCAISLVALVLTMMTILFLKELRVKVPNQILLNFCIALFLTLLVFLAAAERSRTSSKAGCRAAAIALHYFVLATVVWMAIEAFNMYMAFVKVLPSHISKFMQKCYIVGWGIPAVVVAITVGLAFDDYGDGKYCRLYGVPFLASFFGPVSAIFVCNIIAFVFIFHSLLTSGSRVTSDRRGSGLQKARQGIAISILLGLTWLFGVLAVGDAKLYFQYLFCIFNSLQGLLVFLFYCLLPRSTRDLMRGWWRTRARKRWTMKHRPQAKSGDTPRKSASGSEAITLDTYPKNTTDSTVITNTRATDRKSVNPELATKVDDNEPRYAKVDMLKEKGSNNYQAVQAADQENHAFPEEVNVCHLASSNPVAAEKGKDLTVEDLEDETSLPEPMEPRFVSTLEITVNQK